VGAAFAVGAPRSGFAQPLGVPGRAVPLYAVSDRCADPRLPALAGPWVVACGAGGRVDHVLSLQTGADFELPTPLERPGLGPSALYQPGWDSTVLRLTPSGPVPVEGVTRLMDRAAGPPATDGEHIVLVSDDAVQVLGVTQRGRRRHATWAAGWYGAALTWPYVAWVADGWTDGEDVWWMDASAERPSPARLAAGPGHQRHVVAHGGWLAWVEAGAIGLLHPASGTARRVPAETGFSAPITLWEGVVCWEERGGADGVDVRCSDGLAAGGPGDQRWPSRWGPWLLYREGDRVMLATAVAP